MLDVANLQVNYGAAPALWDVSIRVDRGELVCVVGPNGAGKSTLINVIAGLHRARGGRLTFDGQDITQLASHRFCAAGIAVVPEGRRLFTGMSVRDNLELGSYLPAAKAHRAQTLEQVVTLFPILQQKMNAPAGALSGGQQQMVAIGRALMSRPQLLLLDEPSLGLAPAVVLDMFNAIREINARGTSVLLVEQNVSMAMELARRAYVMEEGRIVADGLASELVNRPEIRKAYLGLETHE
ncbi:MAG: transporter ATP-binding protein [Ramlibacter sp.]|jgi:branched-chain amino acid transport system ATP-binding protein|nr:transporter ATP-binding protein [Ramlibacter sp.]